MSAGITPMDSNVFIGAGEQKNNERGNANAISANCKEAVSECLQGIRIPDRDTLSELSRSDISPPQPLPPLPVPLLHNDYRPLCKATASPIKLSPVLQCVWEVMEDELSPHEKARMLSITSHIQITSANRPDSAEIGRATGEAGHDDETLEASTCARGGSSLSREDEIYGISEAGAKETHQAGTKDNSTGDINFKDERTEPEHEKGETVFNTSAVPIFIGVYEYLRGETANEDDIYTIKGADEHCGVGSFSRFFEVRRAAGIDSGPIDIHRSRSNRKGQRLILQSQDVRHERATYQGIPFANERQSQQGVQRAKISTREPNLATVWKLISYCSSPEVRGSMHTFFTTAGSDREPPSAHAQGAVGTE